MTPPPPFVASGTQCSCVCVVADFPGDNQGQGDVGGDLCEPHDERGDRTVVPEHVGGHDAGGILLLLLGAVCHLRRLLLFLGECCSIAQLT